MSANNKRLQNFFAEREKYGGWHYSPILGISIPSRSIYDKNLQKLSKIAPNFACLPSKKIILRKLFKFEHLDY